MLDYFLTEHPCASLIIGLILTVVITVAVVNVPIYYVMDHSCAKRAELLNTEHHFGYLEGCWLKDKDNNTWYEYTTLRNVEVK